MTNGVSINYYGKLFTSNTEVTPAIARAANIAKTYGLALVKARTPVDTGDLKGSWKAKLEGNGIRWSNEKYYAGFVEFGTVKMSPRHMLTETLPDVEEVFTEELYKEVGKAIAGDVVSTYVSPGYGNAGVSSNPGRYKNVGNNLQPKIKTGLTKRGKNNKSYLFSDPAKILNNKLKRNIKSAKPLL